MYYKVVPLNGIPARLQVTTFVLLTKITDKHSTPQINVFVVIFHSRHAHLQNVIYKYSFSV